MPEVPEPEPVFSEEINVEVVISTVSVQIGTSVVMVIV